MQEHMQGEHSSTWPPCQDQLVEHSSTWPPSQDQLVGGNGGGNCLEVEGGGPEEVMSAHVSPYQSHTVTVSQWVRIRKSEKENSRRDLM